MIDIEFRENKVDPLKTKENLALSLAYLLSHVDLSAYQSDAINFGNNYFNDDSVLDLFNHISTMPELYVISFPMIREIRIHASLILSLLKKINQESQKLSEINQTKETIILKLNEYFSEYKAMQIEMGINLTNLEHEKKSIKRKLNEKLKYYSYYANLYEKTLICNKISNYLFELPLFKKGPFIYALKSHIKCLNPPKMDLYLNKID